jgi:AraC family transcriptional regulator, regulatory protein of adaptative response / methylated-DNA-[protein]-cysteine methyltransferase
MSVDPLAQQSRHYAVVARAIAYLRAHAQSQPALDEVAAAVNLSPFHLQRVFSEWTGISPKRFLQYLTKEHALRELAGEAGVFDAALVSGLSGGGRLHDLMVSCEAMSPGEIRSGGAGLDIVWGFGPTPFGEALVASTPRGICQLAFVTDDAGAPAAELAARWPNARRRRDDAVASALLAQVFSATPARGTLHLLLRGTNFQIKVWEALIRIPPGTVLSYGALARRIGQPSAQRAVGSALAANDVAWLIPCHRVIRESGDYGNYRWGVERKRAMLGYESALTGSAIPQPPGR